MRKTNNYKMIYAAETTAPKAQRRFKIIEAFNKTQAKETLKSLYKYNIKILEIIKL